MSALCRPSAMVTCNQLSREPSVVGADLLDPETGPQATLSIEATIEGDGVPASVLSLLARRDARLVDATRRVDHMQIVVLP